MLLTPIMECIIKKNSKMWKCKRNENTHDSSINGLRNPKPFLVHQPNLLHLLDNLNTAYTALSWLPTLTEPSFGRSKGQPAYPLRNSSHHLMFSRGDDLLINIWRNVGYLGGRGDGRCMERGQVRQRVVGPTAERERDERGVSLRRSKTLSHPPSAAKWF